MSTESEERTSLRGPSRLFIAENSFSNFEWVEIPFNSQLMDRIVNLYKLMQDNCIESIEVEITATWKLPRGWSNQGYSTRLKLLDNVALAQTLVEAQGDMLANPGSGALKQIEQLILPFSFPSKIFSILQPVLDAQEDFIKAPQCFGCTVDGVFQATADERLLLWESGCIKRLDAVVTSKTNTRHWRRLQNEYFEKRVNRYLVNIGQPILSLESEFGPLW